MSKRASLLITFCLLLAVTISACTAIVAAPAQPPAQKTQPIQPGIEPSSPLATSVLLQSCSGYDCELHLYDTESGAAPAGFEPIDLGSYSTFGPSSDLTQLALISYRGNSSLQDGLLKFVDLATWEVVTTTLTFDGAYNSPIFTPDKSRLLVLTQTETWPATDTVYLVDIATSAILAEQNLDFYPMNFQFTADGASIMFYGINGTDSATGTNTKSQVALLDATSLEIVWQEQVEGLVNGQVLPEGSTNPMDGIYWQPAATFAPDQPLLYIVHAEQEQLTTVDYSAQNIATRAITKPLSWIERLLALTARTAHAKMMNGTTKQVALSPDGSHLYVSGTQYSSEDTISLKQGGLGLQVIDVATGEVSAHINTDTQSVSIDPDNGRLYLHGWAVDQGEPYTNEWTEVLDGSNYELVRRLEDQAVAVARRLDGTPILLATTTLENGKTELSTLDAETFEVISSSADWHGGYMGWVVLR